MSTIRPPPADRTPGLRCTRAAAPARPRPRRCLHADVAGAEPAGHDLLHGDLARDAVLPAEPLHQLHEPVRAAGVERIRPALPRSAARRIASTFSTALLPSVSSTEIDLADLRRTGRPPSRIRRCARSGSRSRATPFSPASCEIGAKVASPTPRPSTTTLFQPGSSVKPTPERPDHVERVADRERREPAGAAADAFVEELDAAGRAVDPVDALRPAQPQLAHVGRGTQQVEELARA